MNGILFAAMAGFFICLQAVFNTRVSEKVGFWGTNAFVHATGLIAALLILALTRDINIQGLAETSPLYLLGGVLGVLIIFSIMKGVSLLGATVAIGIVLVVQLATAAMIDGFGLFGTPVKPFHLMKLVGLLVMVAGIVIFQIKD